MHLLYGRETAKETEGKGRKERGSPRKEGGGRGNGRKGGGKGEGDGREMGEKTKGKFLYNKQTGTRLSKLFMKKAGE